MVSRAILLGAVAALVLCLCESATFAHAKLLRTQPADKAALKQSPPKVELWFNEELQAQFNTITVTDQSGKRVDKNDLSLGEGNKKVEIDLENLASGTYMVAWKVLSADQHTMKGQFTFTVEITGPPNAATSPAQVGQQPSMSPQTTPSESMQESGVSFSLSAIRWLQYLASMTLFGGFLFQLLILGPSLRRIPGIAENEKAVTLRRSTARFTQLCWLSVGLLAVAIVASLIAQAATVLDISFAQALAPSRLYQVCMSTGFGGLWLLEFIMLVLVAAALFIFAISSQRWTLWFGALVIAIMFYALSSTGHAGAAAKEWRSALVSDWLHLVTAGLWVGGLFHMALILPRAVSSLGSPQRLRLIKEVIPLFTRYAIPATILIALTGVYNSWIHLDSFAALWNTAYGTTILLKVAIFIPMIVLGGVNTFIIHPRAKRSLETEKQVPELQQSKLSQDFRRSIATEALLGVAVLLAAAVLVFLQPAREHPGVARGATPESAITHKLR
jgi:copper transport protein